MEAQQINETETTEEERMWNISEYFYQRGSKAISKNYEINLILLAFSVLFFIGIEIIVIVGKRVQEATKPSDYSGYTFLIFFALAAFGLGIAVLAVANKLKEHKKWLKLGSIYPKQKHIYYPFDGDFSQIKNHNRYSAAIHNPDLVFCDPTYVHRIVPEWTQIESEPSSIRWITPQKRGVGDRNLSFAILPLTAGTWKGGPVVFRCFAKNNSGNSRTLQLQYYPVAPTKQLIRKPPMTFLNVSVPGSSIVYRDILMYNTTRSYSTGGDAYSSGGMRVFAIVDWWTDTHVHTSGGYKHTRVEWSSQMITIIPFFEEGLNPLKTTLDTDMDYSKQLTKIFLIGQNPFISPAGMKEVLLYALTGGDMTSRELLRWKEQMGKKWMNIHLIIGGITLTILVLLLIFAKFNTLGVFLALYILGLIGYLIKTATTVPESKYMELLYKLGLTQNPKFIALEDVELSLEKNKEWFALTASSEKIRNLTIPVDFCMSLSDLRAQAFSYNSFMSRLDFQREKILRYPQYRYRLQQINLPSLYYIPALEPRLTEMKIKFSFDVPDQTVTFMEFKKEEVKQDIVETSNILKSLCSNCEEEFDFGLVYCPICGTPIKVEVSK
ncbi:MAG: hypothetical protein ACTSPO_14015 [Candidatus Heimdallarchaeaceae archaeon]